MSGPSLLLAIQNMWWLSKLTLARVNALINRLTGTWFGGSVSGSTTLTGTTAETTLYTQTIPGGSIGNRGMLVIQLVGYTPSSNTNTKTFRVKLGGTTFASGSLTSVLTGAGTVMIFNAGAQNQQVSHPGIFTGQTTTGSAQTLGTVDTSVDQTLTITGQLQSSSDSMTLGGVAVQVLTAYSGG